MELLLISWNVNGIRACVRNGFLDFLEKYKPDILALQEIKATEEESFVSEYVWAPAWSFTRRLVLRNRLIASFAEVLVLLQAPLKSGALITATFASLLNKPVYVLKPKKICYATAGGVYFKNNHRKTYWLN